MSKKASQSFASADAKAVLYVFCRDMCVAENTLRGVSVELSAVSGQLRRRTQRSFLEKVAKPLFRQSQPPLQGGHDTQVMIHTVSLFVHRCISIIFCQRITNLRALMPPLKREVAKISRIFAGGILLPNVHGLRLKATRP